ncbi:MAG: hypothetical protein KIT86_04705 [Hydrogenophaga sp.]|jgi:hypothetical protein|uniref:hypothetical protein n=1 Tax=Hydrogenophaga sp. TaxID=1904254 RepID=UPI0026066D62|nr:hypothetical protein [Hydrogenophaga sp.]MCW5668938.1 hypothetical protein [Hydrogenophaga sp.]
MTQNPPSPLPARHDSLAAREIAIEHGALTRQVAGLQRRVGEQLRAWALQVSALEDEVLYLRAQLMVSRTCQLWGLGVAGVMKPLARRVPPPAGQAGARAMAEASSVICQTGCVGHAHPWLEGDGQCRRTGQTCDLYASGLQEAAR